MLFNVYWMCECMEEETMQAEMARDASRMRAGAAFFLFDGGHF